MTISPEGSFRFPKTEGKAPRLPLPFCYVCAISIATLSFMIVSGVSDYLGPGAPNDPFAVRISMIFVGTIIAGFFFWAFTVVAAILPGATIYLVARRFAIENALYYIICGTITGLIITPFGRELYSYFYPPGEDGPTFLQSCLVLAPKMAFYGICGALTFWYMAGRRLNSMRVMVASDLELPRPAIWMARYGGIRRDRPPLSVCYLQAVNVAVLSHVTVGIVVGLVGIYLLPHLPQVSPVMLVFSLIVLMLIGGCFFWLFAIVAAIPPGAAIYAIARRFGIDSASYYLVCGAIIGLALTPIWEFVSVQIYPLGDEHDFLHACLSLAPKMAFCGICGAFAFWYMAGRHLFSERAMVMGDVDAAREA